MPGQWIVVARADHVARGVAGGIVQACHGKRGPLARMKPGDQVFCYSPVATFGGSERLQAFTAMGTILDGDPYEGDSALPSHRRPYRRNVAWQRVGLAPIRPLLDKLDLTKGRQNWGMPFRLGLLPINAHDAALIGIALSLASARPTAAHTPRSSAMARAA